MRFLEQRSNQTLAGSFLESSRVLHEQICATIAFDLIDSRGQLAENRLDEWIAFFASFQSIVGPGYRFDSPRLDQVRFALMQLKELNLKTCIQRFNVPKNGTLGMHLLRKVPSLVSKQTLVDSDVRRSVLAAFLSEMRQTIGSCFATAAGQYIREKEPKQFFKDLESILYLGGLQRVFEGKELKVPALLNIGEGELHTKVLRSKEKRMLTFLIYDTLAHVLEEKAVSVAQVWHFVKRGTSEEISLHDELARFFQEHFAIPAPIWKERFAPEGAAFDSHWLKLQEFWQAAKVHAAGYEQNPLLKAWEYALASFSDVKLEFAYWNSFLALGLDPKEPKGLSAYLHEELQSRVDELSEQVEEIQKDLQTTGGYIQSLQLRARSASSENDLARMQSSARGQESRYQRLRAEMRAMQQRIHILAQALPPIIQSLADKFQDYFQEVYDPSLAQSERGRLRDDRIAGFCLAVKRGLTDPSLWTLIKTQEAYSAHLSQFFQSYFADMSHLDALEEIHSKDLSFISTALYRFISQTDFIEHAMQRCKKRKFKGFDAAYYTPWSYLAGGSLTQVLEVYYGKKGAFEEVEKVASSNEELLAFYIESAFELDFIDQEISKKSPFVGGRFLMSAPEHSCLFQPGSKSFLAGWSKEQFPFTWVRDCVMAPSVAALKGYTFSPFAAAGFLDRLKGELPLNFRELTEDLDFSNLGLEEAAKRFLKRAPAPLRSYALSLFDACAYSFLPILQGQYAYEAIQELLFSLLPEQRRACEEALRQSNLRHQIPKHALFDKAELFEFVKALYIRASQSVASPFVIEERLEKLANELGYTMSRSLRFADSNWTKDYLSFVVNPRSLVLEVWRTDFSASLGAPMEAWNAETATGKARWSLFKKRLS